MTVTVIVQTIAGPRRVLPAALEAPPGARRCWWCCTGRLIQMGPQLADPNDVEAVRLERERDDDLMAAHRLRFSPPSQEERLASCEAATRREMAERNRRNQPGEFPNLMREVF
jgi:hypothetical protein